MSRSEHLSPADTAWLRLERPENLMVITAVLRFEGRLEADQLRRRVQHRLVDSYPRFSRRMVRRSHWPRRPVWQPDPALDLAHHVPVHDVTGDLDDARLASLVGELMGRPLDLSRSPWQLHLVSGESESAVVARIHHSLADGIALATVLLSLTDGAEGVGSMASRSATPGHGPSVGAVVAAGVGAVRAGFQVAGFTLAGRTAPRAGLGTRKVVSWTRPHDLARVKDTARASGASVNDLLLAATAGGLRRQLIELGKTPSDVRVLVPANLRPAGEAVSPALGNRFGVVFVRLPVSEAEPRARLRAVVARTGAVKISGQAPGTFVLLSLVGVLPRAVSGLAAWLVGGAASAVLTNVPGPRDPLALLGCPMSSVVFWVPQVGTIGLGISVFTYAGSVTIGVAADTHLDLDPAALAAAIEAELDELVHLAPPR